MTVHHSSRRWIVSAAGGLAALALDSCAPEAAKAPAEPAAPAAPAAAAIKLPVSLNAVMVAVVDHSADAIWEAATKPPKTDEQWKELEKHAYQLAINGQVIKLAGTGEKDAMWVAQPEWAPFADSLSAAGMEALKAVQTKDLSQIGAIGGRLNDTCLGCHAKFKPDIPTQGILHGEELPK